MKTPIAFISYDYKLSEEARVRFLAEKASQPRSFAVDDWSAPPRSPREDWTKTVRARIGRCDFMIVLVEEGMDTAAVAEEILEAKRCNVPFFGVYVGDAHAGMQLPEGLGANRVAPWDWERITLAVRQVGKEGKHHIFR